jgi:hypothetical protein
VEEWQFEPFSKILEDLGGGGWFFGKYSCRGLAAHCYITLESKKCPVMYNHEPTYKLNELTTKVVN